MQASVIYVGDQVTEANPRIFDTLTKFIIEGSTKFWFSERFSIIPDHEHLNFQFDPSQEYLLDVCVLLTTHLITPTPQ